ncbi:MAG: S8 family serine peptidase [Bdellovibrionales bacterium]|nr:S8 family serine peptidase [Bdellovibrionales bacterium]
MIIRVFLAVATFLLFLAVLTDTPILNLKGVASKPKPKAPPVTREMELGTINTSVQAEEKKESIIMNDPAMHKKWGLAKTDALDAWQLTTGSREIIVAVVDTGIDIEHPDLKNNLWVNPGESGKDKHGRNKATNGVDDDGNGFIDDVHGWNFVHSNNYLKDNHGHGTHIAGIVGAEGGNNYGVTGVAPKVSLMILKYFDPQSPGNNLVNTIKAFDYAIKMNAHIINYSGGGMEFSQPEFRAVQRAEQKGILFVAAAGNERSNSDYKKYYPADYDLDNIISVTAINPTLRVLSSSNYGVKTVDIAAPGENIYSTLPGGTFGTMTGTSQATAFVSGVAALLMAHNRDFDAKAVKKYILRTGDNLEWLKSKTNTSKKLNIFRSLTMLDQGVGASGVVASNTSSAESDTFNAPTNQENTGATSLHSFGQALKKFVHKEDESTDKE